MAIRFHSVSSDGITGLTGEVPAGAIVGVIGDDANVLASLAEIASGRKQPTEGAASVAHPARLIASCDLTDAAGSASLVLLHPTAAAPAFEKARFLTAADNARRAGVAIMLITHDQPLLALLCDEIWWIDEGRVKLRASPPDALDAYNGHVASRLAQLPQEIGLHPALRRGDGRARLVSVETLGPGGQTAAVWQSGEPAAVRVRVQFQAPVDDPVVGIMIRTRVGFEVYGTNTELERLRLGPVAEGETLQVTFRFRCDLCPQEYTLTAASHDPDGIWHDWLEDAVAIAVADSRYTAGVANLRAKVTAEKV